MSKGRLYVTLSTVVVVLTLMIVIISNSVITPALANRAKVNPADSVSVKKYTFENEELADKIVGFGTSLIGTPYHYTGKTPSGFDCSGFTHYVFEHFGIELSPASKEQIFAGEQIALSEARKGDLLVFTGTNRSIRQPGHVGIVITEKGVTPVQFVHSSSNGGVKISQVQETNYELRLLQVRRLIK